MMLLAGYLAMTCMLRWKRIPVETGIAASLVTVLDCQLRGVL